MRSDRTKHRHSSCVRLFCLCGVISFLLSEGIARLGLSPGRLAGAGLIPSILLGLLFLHGFPTQVPAAGLHVVPFHGPAPQPPSEPVSSTDWQVASRARDRQVWERTVTERVPGTDRQRVAVHRIIELATGLNDRDDFGDYE